MAQNRGVKIEKCQKSRFFHFLIRDFKKKGLKFPILALPTRPLPTPGTFILNMGFNFCRIYGLYHIPEKKVFQHSWGSLGDGPKYVIFGHFWRFSNFGPTLKNLACYWKKSGSAISCKSEGFKVSLKKKYTFWGSPGRKLQNSWKFYR